MTTLRVTALLALVLAACETPEIHRLKPSSGPPGTLVQIEGRYLFDCNVHWDYGMGSQTIVPSGPFSAQYFTVPSNASTSPHPVRIERDNDWSDEIAIFNVTEGVERPKPRLDDITVNLFKIEDQVAEFNLFAHGANIDAGAKILVSDYQWGGYTDQTTYFLNVMHNNAMHASDPATLGYPIFHYATVFAQMKDIEPGSTLWVKVENLDGQVSSPHEYEVAATLGELDSDGDGLSDVWETEGYTDNGVFVDLPGMGANPHRKDIFVEVDWMEDQQPPAGVFEFVEKAFLHAPVMNHDTSTGIRIHIDRGQYGGNALGGGQEVPYSDRTRWDDLAPESGFTYSNFYKLKEDHFEPARLKSFRYCIYVHENGEYPDTAGMAEDYWCNDFFISLGSENSFNRTRLDLHLGAFMHELGHALNLRHGGNTDGRDKPNYNSVMCYGPLPRVVGASGWLVKRSPSMSGGIDIDCDLTNASGVYTYSQGQRAELKEDQLSEDVGVCDGVDVDFNGNDQIDEGLVSANITGDTGGTTNEVSADFADWARIRIPFVHPDSKWGDN